VTIDVPQEKKKKAEKSAKFQWKEVPGGKYLSRDK